MTTPANLIFIQSDNHNRQVSGCYGHGIVKTPALDKLAGRGVRFASSYSTSALCCPARAAMATGRYPHQTGYWDNAIAYDGRVPSWMRRLRDQGHTVVGIGKLHYRSSDDDNGFSEELTRAPKPISGAWPNSGADAKNSARRHKSSLRPRPACRRKKRGRFPPGGDLRRM